MPIAAANMWWTYIADWTDAVGGSDSQTSLGLLTNVAVFDKVQLASDMNDAFTAAPWYGSGVVLEQGTITNGVLSGVDVSGFGGSGGTLIPFNSAILVRKQTPALPTRRQGRNFYPGVQVAGINSSGQLTAGYQGGLQSNFDALWTAINAITIVEDVIQFTGPATSGGSRPYEVVTGFSVQGKVGTLRRRIRR